MGTKFSKQGIQPNPMEVDYWIDISADPYGSVIKYFNGVEWVDLVADGETGMSPADYYTKDQVDKKLINKADIYSVNAKADSSEIEKLVKDIEIRNVGSLVQLIITKYNGINIAITIPTASNNSTGIVKASDFVNFVKQHQLQSLYSEMYGLFSEVREKYQPRLKAGKNIIIDRQTNTISATGEVAVDWNNISNRPNIPNKTSQLINDSGFITSNEFGNIEASLSQQLDKIDKKVDDTAVALTELEQSVSTQISEGIASIVAGADSSYDTLKEIADYIASDIDGVAAMNSAITDNKNAISAEKTRATSVENKLSQRISNLEEGESIYVTKTTFNNSVQQLTSEDADLLAKIDNETSERNTAIAEVTEIATDAKDLSAEAVNISSEFKYVAEDAKTTSYDFAQVARNAMTTAEGAKNAIATLEGLSNVDTSALTTAEVITQVEQNTSYIEWFKERDVVLSQSVFEALTEKDVTKHYFIYEDEV